MTDGEYYRAVFECFNRPPQQCRCAKCPLLEVMNCRSELMLETRRRMIRTKAAETDGYIQLSMIQGR